MDERGLTKSAKGPHKEIQGFAKRVGLFEWFEGAPCRKKCSHYHSIKSPFVLYRYERGPCRECRGASQRVRRGLTKSEEGPHQKSQGLVKRGPR